MWNVSILAFINYSYMVIHSPLAMLGGSVAPKKHPSVN